MSTEPRGCETDHAGFLRNWADDIRESSGKSVDADRLDAIAARITALEAENQRLRNRAEAEGFWLGKTAEAEKEVKP